MKCFLIDDLDQGLLMPPSLHDWLPENHLARFVVDLVDTLDLSAFYRSYEEKDGRGQAAYHPGARSKSPTSGLKASTCTWRQAGINMAHRPHPSRYRMKVTFCSK